MEIGYIYIPTIPEEEVANVNTQLPLDYRPKNRMCVEERVVLVER